jgi:hypothetical protein
VKKTVTRIKECTIIVVCPAIVTVPVNVAFLAALNKKSWIFYGVQKHP